MSKATLTIILFLSLISDAVLAAPACSGMLAHISFLQDGASTPTADEIYQVYFDLLKELDVSSLKKLQKKMKEGQSFEPRFVGDIKRVDVSETLAVIYQALKQHRSEDEQRSILQQTIKDVLIEQQSHKKAREEVRKAKRKVRHLLTRLEFDGFNKFGGLPAVALEQRNEVIGAVSYTEGKRGIVVWDANSGHIKRKIKTSFDRIEKLLIDPSGKRLAIWDGQKKIELWDPIKLKKIKSSSWQTKRLFDVAHLYFTSQGELRVVSIKGTNKMVKIKEGYSEKLFVQTVAVWDFFKNEILMEVRLPDRINVFEEHVRISADHKRVILLTHEVGDDGGGNFVVASIEIDSGEYRLKNTGEEYQNGSQSNELFETDKDDFVFVSDYFIRFLSLKDSMRKKITFKEDVIRVAKLSPNGSRLAVGTAEGKVIVYDTYTKRKLTTVAKAFRSDSDIVKINFLSDNEYVLAETYDKLFLINTTTGHQIY